MRLFLDGGGRQVAAETILAQQAATA
jgi:hypothetical protein